MVIHCPNCGHRTLCEVSSGDPLVCERCGYEFELVFTGKIYEEGE